MFNIALKYYFMELLYIHIVLLEIKQNKNDRIKKICKNDHVHGNEEKMK